MGDLEFIGGVPYQEFKSIGEGAYGHVVSVRNMADGKLYAMKESKALKDFYNSEFKKKYDALPEQEKKKQDLTDYMNRVKYTLGAFKREYEILKLVAHPNIIRVYNFLESPERGSLFFMELCDIDLHRYLRGPMGTIPMEVLRTLFRQLLWGVAFCHSRGIYHYDLKPANILYNYSTQSLKITDFDSAEGIRHEYDVNDNELICTQMYRPVEIMFSSTNRGYWVDIWSLACIFLEMHSKHVMFAGEGLDDVDQFYSVITVLGTPTKIVDAYDVHARERLARVIPEISTTQDSISDIVGVFPGRGLRTMFRGLNDTCLDLIAQMLSYDYRNRITAEIALRHRFFTVPLIDQT